MPKKKQRALASPSKDLGKAGKNAKARIGKERKANNPRAK